ncbi:MAG TPA: hypothetical protein VGF23_09040 [Gaiellaceae bacterium]
MATIATDSAVTYEEDERGYGWVVFSAVVLGIAGTFSVVDGIVALSKSRFYTANAVYVFSDLRTWGWITLIVGAVTLCAAVAVLGRSQWARWFGITMASLSAIGQLLFVQAYPWWSLAVFALDVLVIYGLAVYGGRRTA